MADDPQITEITTHTINILRVAEAQRQAAVSRLAQLQGEITTMLEQSEKLSPNRLSRLKALQEQTNESIDQAYDDISGQHREGLKKLAGIEAKQAQKLVNTKIGVDVVSVAIPEKLLEAVVDGPHIFGNSAKEWWGGQAADLQAKFKTGMQQGVLLGETVDQLAARVRGTKENSYEDGMMAAKRREAQALVRSAAISVANEARLRQFEDMGDLVKGIQWVATLDTRTTAQCRGLDGKMWRLPDYEPVGHDKAWPGPTAHWNCFTGDVGVSSPAIIRRLYRRPYTGELVTIETDNGRRITATPNHPILTADGWRPIGGIQVGEDLLCEKGTGTGPVGGPDDERGETSFAELAEATTKLRSVVAVEMPHSRPDFHGDVPHNEIGEVWTYGDLDLELDGTMPKLLRYQRLQRRDLHIAQGLPCGGHCEQSGPLSGPTSYGGIGGQRGGPDAPTPASVEIVGAGASNASCSAPASERGQGHPKLPSDFTGRELIGDVETDRVRMVSRREAVAIPVHNLETSTGWYLASGIISHNCRSTQIAVLRSWEELSGKKLPTIGDEALEKRMGELLKGQGWSDEKISKAKARTRASMDGQVADSVDFEGWLRLQPDSRVEAILGPGRKALWETGQVTVAQMTDQTNRPLTLAQLEQLVETGGTAPETLGVQFLPMVAESTSLTAKTTAELNRKAEAEIESIEEEADPEAKPKPTPPDDSAATIAKILASPAGQTLKAKWIAKIQKENPEMEPKDVLANATQQALLEQTSKSKAAALAAARKKLVAGEDLTPAQKKTVEELTPEEAANFNDAVQAAKGEAAAKAEVTKTAEKLKAQEEATATTKQTLAQEQAAAAKKARLQAITDMAAKDTLNDNFDRTGLSKQELIDARNAGFKIRADIQKGLIKPPPGPPIQQDPARAFKEAYWEFDRDTFARGETVSSFEDLVPYLGTDKEGVAVLSAFGHSTFAEINNPQDKIQRKAADAMLRMVESIPNAQVEKIHRVVAFGSPDERAAFIKQLQSEAPQERTISSWTKDDPGAPGQNANNNIALDLASQFGEERVFMTIEAPMTAKEISFLYGKDSDQSGVEYVMQKGTSLKVLRLEERNGDIHIVFQQAPPKPKKKGS
jgi:SPP1 gp7 family putative phage head morphogenesis protein